MEEEERGAGCWLCLEGTGLSRQFSGVGAEGPSGQRRVPGPPEVCLQEHPLRVRATGPSHACSRPAPGPSRTHLEQLHVAGREPASAPVFLLALPPAPVRDLQQRDHFARRETQPLAVPLPGEGVQGPAAGAGHGPSAAAHRAARIPAELRGVPGTGSRGCRAPGARGPRVSEDSGRGGAAATSPGPAALQARLRPRGGAQGRRRRRRRLGPNFSGTRKASRAPGRRPRGPALLPSQRRLRASQPDGRLGSGGDPRPSSGAQWVGRVAPNPCGSARCKAGRGSRAGEAGNRAGTEGGTEGVPTRLPPQMVTSTEARLRAGFAGLVAGARPAPSR